jgi:hypothetical protein
MGETYPNKFAREGARMEKVTIVKHELEVTGTLVQDFFF